MTTETTQPTQALPISTHTEMLPVSKFYVDNSVTKTDVRKNPMLNIYSSRYLRVYSTITNFNLTKEDARAIAMSSVERYPDEDYTDYKVRLKARDGFASVYKRVFMDIEKSQANKLN